MSCKDIPSLLDLQKVKKHADDFGRLMGTGNGTSTNGVTGQVRPTYNAVMKSVGFKPGSGDFTTGFTVMPGERDVAWYDPVSLNWYSYLGVIPSDGYDVAPGTNPVGSVNWVPRTDQLLREELVSESGAGMVGGLPVFVTATKYAGGTTTSSTNNDAAIIAAINDAIATGNCVYWPSTYEVQGNIANFHSVKHFGPGAIKRGSDTFRVHPLEWHTNTIYVSNSGSDANDGLTPALPKLSIQSAIDALKGYQDAAICSGDWVIKVDSGTYARGKFPDEGFRTKNPVRIVGADVGGHPNIPTTLIKEGATEAAFGLLIQRRTDVVVQDIKFEDFNGSKSSAGISAQNRCNVSTINCHFEDCYIGLSGTEWCEIDVKGGIFNDCGYLNSVTPGGYGIRGLFHCKFSVGLQNAGARTQGPFFTNNYFAMFGQEMCTGHADWCSFTGNNTGIRLNVGSRINCGGSLFDSNGFAAWATDNSMVSSNANSTFTNNNQNIVTTGKSGSTSSPVIAEWKESYGRDEYVVWGSKAQQTVNTLSATVIQTATIKAGMLRETYGSLVPPKKIGFRMFGRLVGTNDIKRIQLRLGAGSPVNITFTATEVGAFEASGEIVLRSPDNQVGKVSGFRFGGLVSRVSVLPLSESLLSDTPFTIEVLVGNVADSVVVEYAELFMAGV